jgi:hypothetical protein
MQPPLGNLDLLNWKAFDRTVDAGYRYAIEKLAISREVLRLDRKTTKAVPMVANASGDLELAVMRRAS